MGGGRTFVEVEAMGRVVSPSDAGALSPAQLISLSSAIRLILPLFSGRSVDELDDAAALLPTLRVVSSLNGHAGNCRGDEGSASDTRRCCFREDGDVGVLILVAGT